MSARTAGEGSRLLHAAARVDWASATPTARFSARGGGECITAWCVCGRVDNSGGAGEPAAQRAAHTGRAGSARAILTARGITGGDPFERVAE